MAFDLDLPADNSLIVALELRNQFQGLNEIVQEVSGSVSAKVDQAQLDNVAADLQAQLGSAITNDTAGTFSSVADFDLTVSDPPTQAEVQAIADRLHEVINAGKRV
jgi:hypothetical protein